MSKTTQALTNALLAAVAIILCMSGGIAAAYLLSALGWGIIP